jgi:hypothetical protein
VLLFVEGCRNVIVDALLPVHRELLARGIESEAVSFGSGDGLPVETLELRVPAAALTPSWALESWDGLCDAVEELRDPSLKRSFFYYCASGTALLDECRRVLDLLDPQVVMTASNPMEGGVAMGVASLERGAQTLLSQHGIMQAFNTPVVADRMLTWGSSSTRTLERLGVESDRLVTLGSPRHDAMMPAKDGSARRRLLEALGLPDRPTFAFFSNGNDLVRNGIAPFECSRWLESIAAEYSSDLNVVVRLHPNEDGDLFRDCPNVSVTKDQPDLSTTLEGCDVVGSLCSTVLYDALLYGKPVWQFYADGWPDLADNWKNGLATRVSTALELRAFIDEMLRVGPQSDQSLCADIFANHGRATQAVADYVVSHLARPAASASNCPKF